MKHSVQFENVENRWENALPLGNGVFGAMAYYSGNTLCLPTNHYEVYYTVSSRALPKDRLAAEAPVDEPGKLHRETELRAKRNLPDEGEPYTYYRKDKAAKTPLGKVRGTKFASHHPATGELKAVFSDALKNAVSRLVLEVEDARVRLDLEKDGRSAEVSSFVAREDCLVCSVKQSERGLLPSLKLDYPPFRGKKYPNVIYAQEDGRTFLYEVSFDPDGQENEEGDVGGSFRFCGVLRLVGAEGRLTKGEYGARIDLVSAGKEFRILFGVFTSRKYVDPRRDGVGKMNSFEERLPELYANHREYWSDFFARSNIGIPDKFLENVYYINQYALDCCSGRDGVMRHQACGLNGLWDIKHPNLWGSMWYWDVNIQAAFAGVFSSGRTELAKAFSDGLREYLPLAESFAKRVHGLSGAAADYPYAFYYCVWPWCAQYLWYYYEYTLDEDYLRNEAYPLFLKVCEFLLGVFKYDGPRGYYSVFPDISPEQGPLAHDSIATVASAKYLFRFTLEAAKILNDGSPLLEKIKRVCENTAPYFTSGEGTYGRHLIDSEEAPEFMWIRHPGMLMPLYPIGEYGIDSPEKTKKVLSDTLDYLEDRCETGIFQGSWLAAAAARLGQGQRALRLLYERGLDHMMRENGLCAEQTDRFINFCLTCRQPLYYPCMTEFTGEMTSALNEMLLQSHGGVIRVFPALPDGKRDYSAFLRRGYSLAEYEARNADYPEWKDVRFDRLLAKGAFEVSAEMRKGKLVFISVLGKKGGKAVVASPLFTGNEKVFSDGREVPFCREEGKIVFETEADITYVISEDRAVEIKRPSDGEYAPGVTEHFSYTKRRIFIGGDPESYYKTALDNATRPYYIGNLKQENRSVYKFDFTEDKDKDYADAFYPQAYTSEEMTLGALPFETPGAAEFSHFRGFGFSKGSDVRITDSGTTDALRRDFAEGEREAEFIIEAPRGFYELFVVSGDSKEKSYTELSAENGRKCKGTLTPAGRYRTFVIPVFTEEDEPIRLKLSTVPGRRWKINYIVMNRIKP